MPFDIQPENFRSLSELAIIIRIVKAAFCELRCKVLDRKMEITPSMKNGRG